MKLYDVPNNTKIRVIGDIRIPPEAPEINKDEILKFLHIDGMYSLCKNSNGDFVHLVAWAEVEIINSKKQTEFLMKKIGYENEI